MSDSLKRLVIYFALGVLAVNLVLLASNQENVLSFTFEFLVSPIYDSHDSWGPMHDALAHLRSDGEKSLYQHLFFDQKVKFQYSPTSLLFLHPFQSWDLIRLSVFLNLISWLAVWATAILICRIFFEFHTDLKDQAVRGSSRSKRRSYYIVLFCFTLTFYPLIWSWKLGQLQTFIAFLFSLSFWFFVRDRKFASGLVTGLICLLKPQLWLLVIWAGLRKEKRFLWGWAVLVLPALAVSLFLYGVANHLDYVKVLSFLSKHGESFYPNQSMNGLLNRAFSTGNNLTWHYHQFPKFHPWVFGGTLVTSLLLILAGTFAGLREYKKSARAGGIAFLIAALSYTMASPIAWEHHYGIMLTLFACAIPLTFELSEGRCLLLLLALSYLLSGNFWSIANYSANTPFNLIQSYLYGGAVLLLVCLFVLKRWSLFAYAPIEETLDHHDSPRRANSRRACQYAPSVRPNQIQLKQ